jgi:hypothetical protein
MLVAANREVPMPEAQTKPMLAKRYFSQRLGRMVELDYPQMATKPHPGIVLRHPNGDTEIVSAYNPGSPFYHLPRLIPAQKSLP